MKTLESEKAYDIYYESIIHAISLRDAAVASNKQGFNPSCDYQDQWYIALNDAKCTLGDFLFYSDGE